jgi:hypothetical protein
VNTRAGVLRQFLMCSGIRALVRYVVLSRRSAALLAVPASSLIFLVGNANANFGPGTELVGPMGANFGSSVALSSDGTTAIVGAPGYALNSCSSGKGGALVFVKSGGSWSQQASLLDCLDPTSSGTGASVAISADGNTAVVGSPSSRGGDGEGFVFSRAGATWTETGVIALNVGAGAAEGTTIAISGNGSTILIAGLDNSCNARIYKQVGGVWTQVHQFHDPAASGTAGQGGVALSYDGTTALVGESAYSSSAGRAIVYSYSQGSWTRSAPLGWSGSDGAGLSVALSSDGQRAVIGSAGRTATSEVFVHSTGPTGDSWIGRRVATADGSQSDSTGVSGDGHTTITGPVSNGAQVMTDATGTWLPLGQNLFGSPATASSNDGANVQLSADGNTAITGGTGDDGAWVFSEQASQPICSVSSIIRAGSFGAKFDRELVNVSAANGLAAVSQIKIANGTVSYALSPGSTQPITVTAIKAVQGAQTQWSFDATDDAGNVTLCI